MIKITNRRESFELLLDFLELNGNQVVGKRWSAFNKEGRFTLMSQAIDFELLWKNFTFDDTISINPNYQSIDSYNEAFHIYYRSNPPK